MIKKKIVNCRYELKFDYYVTDDGRVWSDRSNKFLNPQSDKDGYQKVQLMSIDGKRHRYSIHRLVLENFCPIDNMSELQINHIDGDKKNNSLSNLEWCTCQENIDHAIAHHLRAKVNGAVKLTKEQVIEIYKRNIAGESNIKLGQEFNVHPDTIGRIKHKHYWKEVLDQLS